MQIVPTGTSSLQESNESKERTIITMQAKVNIADGKYVEAEKGYGEVKNKLAESTEHYRLASEQARKFQADLECASVELKQARESELKACSQLVETQSGVENVTSEREKSQLKDDDQD